METTWTRPLTWLDLYDWRQRVAALYVARDAALRAGTDPVEVAARFRRGKDDLFTRHPQSPLADDVRPTFAGLPYYPYDPAWRITARVIPLPNLTSPDEADSGATGWRLVPAARAEFSHAGSPYHLTIYWIDVYGGGLFLPFRDATGGTTTYGGGRYLMDTVKGSDLFHPDTPDAGAMGYQGDQVVLDFNYAYHPSCTYDVRWVCPLSPRENALPVAIEAGEMLGAGH